MPITPLRPDPLEMEAAVARAHKTATLVAQSIEEMTVATARVFEMSQTASRSPSEVVGGLIGTGVGLVLGAGSLSVFAIAMYAAPLVICGIGMIGLGAGVLMV